MWNLKIMLVLSEGGDFWAVVMTWIFFNSSDVGVIEVTTPLGLPMTTMASLGKCVWIAAN